MAADPKKFARIAESLRQYRRADLRDFDKELGERPVEALYVDPLPKDSILTSVLSGNTTYLLGRKGTGKSTVFARAQSELRSQRDVLTVYVDVKSLYDLPNAIDAIPRKIDKHEIDEGVCRAHLLRKAFIGAVIAELIKEVSNLSTELSLWERWKGKRRSYDELTKKLTSLSTTVKEAKLPDHELPVLSVISTKLKSRIKNETGNKSKAKAGASASNVGVKINLDATSEDFDKSLDDNELYEQYSDVVLRSFPFKELIGELQGLLSESGMKRLVVFFDDFSELNWNDQRLFVDVVLSPLNNSSNESIKLKVAGYPGRVYYGKIDASKIDTISLDFAALYEASDVQTMERSAIEYTSRLISTRFSAFGAEASEYFDASVPFEDYMKVLFQCTFNVPRLMGSLLHICYLDRVSSDNPITTASLRLAARKYYETTISQYFSMMARFALEPFENKLDRHNQEQLLKCILKEASDVRKKIIDGSVGGSYFKRMGNPPTSHFVVSASLGDIFKSLESNFLVSKYKDTRDKDGNPVVVYALFLGLVDLERMAWGYPSGREYRNYFVQRCFDFTSAVHEFLSKSQTIRCGSCGKSHPLEQRKSFELFKWKCPDCKDGLCTVISLADDFRQEVQRTNKELMLEPVELSILQTLEEEARPMSAGEISGLIDVTYQLVGRRTSKLRDKGLVNKSEAADDRRMKSTLTKKASDIYFK